MLDISDQTVMSSWATGHFLLLVVDNEDVKTNKRWNNKTDTRRLKGAVHHVQSTQMMKSRCYSCCVNEELSAPSEAAQDLWNN